MTVLRALRWLLAAPFALVGWTAVLLGDAGYGVGTVFGWIASRIRGPP